MGSFVEINDTLRISKEQGFPAELDLQTHLKKPYSFDMVKGKLFSFHAKPKFVSTSNHQFVTSWWKT